MFWTTMALSGATKTMGFMGSWTTRTRNIWQKCSDIWPDPGEDRHDRGEKGAKRVGGKGQGLG